MNRTVLLLILFLLLGAAAWFLLSREDSRTTLAGWDRDFAVPDTGSIYKIFLADRQGERVTLERQDGYWIYNGRWKARPNAMENLLDAVSRIEMQYKPSATAVDNMVRDLATHGIKVELYERAGRLIRAYYVGGGTADETGTHIMMEGADQPYVGHLRGWTGNLRHRFSLKGEEWRDKTVFDLQPEDIRSVTVEYPKQKNRSFRLERQNGEFAVTPFYEVTPVIDQHPLSGRVEAFLTGFDNLAAEAFENANPRRDSVRQLIPFSIITVTDRSGREHSARLFPIYPRPIYDYDAGKLLNSPPVERYFAELGTGDFMLVQDRLFRRILWGYDFFFEHPEDPATEN